MRRRTRQKEEAEARTKLKPEERRLLELEEEVEHLTVMQLGMEGWVELLNRAEEVQEARRAARGDK